MAESHEILFQAPFHYRNKAIEEQLLLKGVAPY